MYTIAQGAGIEEAQRSTRCAIPSLCLFPNLDIKLGLEPHPFKYLEGVVTPQHKTSCRGKQHTKYPSLKTVLALLCCPACWVIMWEGNL
jgi:hypothetical protein